MASPVPVINFISPLSGPTTGGTQVTIFGQSFLNGCRVRFGGVDSPAVTFVNSTQLFAVTPPGQADGPVNVRVVNSPGVAAVAQDAFTYVTAPPPPSPVPIINAVTPSTGSRSGGTQVTITGQNFVPGCIAKFGGVEAQTTFVSSTQLNATTPAAQADGLVTVRALNPGQSQAGILQNAFQYISAPPPPPPPPPLITGVSPSSGPLAGGTQVTITGQNFLQGCVARFGGVAAQTTFVGSTQLNVITPSAQTAGAVNVRVVNPGQQAAVAQNAFTYVSEPPPPPTPAQPIITFINPSSGPTTGGTQVTIEGQNFASNCQVKFEGNPASVLSNSPTRLVVSTPLVASAGPATVRVINPGQQPAIAQNGFTYLNAPPPPPPPVPIINAVSPSSGLLSGGTQVTIFGQNFAQGCQVKFGGSLAQVLSSTASQLLVSTPAAQSIGLVNVRVANPDGQSFVLQNAFQYLAAPPPPSTKVDVVAPGGGEVLRAGQSFTARWNTSGPVTLHNVRLSLDGGANFNNVAAADLPAGARELTFTLPSPPTSSVNAVVRVAAKDASGAQVAKGDSQPFTLQGAAPAPAPVRVNLKFPNGGESFEEAQRIDISWESSSGVALARHDVLLSLDGGTTFSNVASNLGGDARSFSLVVPAVESERARIQIVARDASGAQASDMSESNFAVTAGPPRIDSVTVGGMPASLSRGTFITLTVKGRKLPAMPAGAANDFVFKRVEGTQEVFEPAFVIRKVSGETKKERQLQVEVLPSATPGQYKLALGAAANTPSQPIAPPLVARGTVADDGSLIFPVGFDVAAVRYGKRLSGPGQTPVPHLSVLLVKGQSTEAESIVLTFVPGMRVAALEIPRRGPERFTDVQFADFLGKDQHFLVGISGRGQKSKSDIDPAFEVFDPVSGQALELTDTTVQGNPAFRRTLIRACDATNPTCMSTDPNGIRPNVDGAFVTKLDGKKEVMAIIPQVSFLTFEVARIDAFVYFLHASPNGSSVRLTKTKVQNVDGNPIERSMVTFADLKANASDTSKKMLVFSKSVIFTFDLATRTLLQSRVRQITDPINPTIDNSRDVADFPRRNDCDPGQDKVSKKDQCSPQGRRYGQYRVLSFADAGKPSGAPVKTRLVVAGHSVSGSIPAGGYAPGQPQVDFGLTPLHTAYGNPLLDDAAPNIPNKRFLAPIAEWTGATDVGAPMMGKYQSPFRSFYRYFPKSKKKRFFGLKRFLNGALLYRGTPPSGIDFIGDMEDGPTPSRPIPSIVVSSALEDPKRVTPKDDDEEGIQTTFPKVMSAGFEIVRADNGRTREKLTMAGAIAIDVVKPSPNSQSARILAWTGLTEGGSYDDGRLQVYAIERVGFGLRLVPKLRETDEPEEPALLDYSTLNRPPEGIAISGESIALFNAVIEVNGRRAILTYPKSNPSQAFPRIANAYDVETLERRLTGVNLGGNLLAIAAPGELTLNSVTPDSSTLVLLDGNRMLFKSVVASPTAWSLASVSFITNAPPSTLTSRETKGFKESGNTITTKDDFKRGFGFNRVAPSQQAEESTRKGRTP